MLTTADIDALLEKLNGLDLADLPERSQSRIEDAVIELAGAIDDGSHEDSNDLFDREDVQGTREAAQLSRQRVRSAVQLSRQRREQPDPLYYAKRFTTR